jgi:type I restriction enzyme S subunit
MPAHWEWRRLDSLCADIVDCPHSTPILASDGPLLARSQDIRTGVFRAEHAAHVSEATYRDRIRRAEPAYGDLLYSREGTYFGIAAEVPRGERVCLGQRMVLLRPKRSEINHRFLRYWLNSPVLTSHIEGFRDGSVAERLNLPTIKALPVAFPPIAEQDRISEILGALDDKIELNRRTNETLEAIAQSVFSEWFVNVSGPATPLDGYLEVDPKETLAKGSMVPWIEMRDLPTAGSSVAGVGARVYAGGSRFRNGDTLLARITPCLENGKTALVDVLGRDQVGAGSTEFIVIRPGRGVPPAWVYCLARDEGFRDFAIQQMNGSSGRQRVSASALKQYLIPEAADTRLADFGRVTEPMFARISCNQRESQTLAQLRDTLLPKILSGELRVREAEDVVDNATAGATA